VINNILTFTYKSWKDGSNLSSAVFNQINIIFGHNGAGKSSLAYGLYKEHTKTGADKASVRLFGGKYVDSTLLLEDKAGIRGVISNFGEKDVDLEEKILKNTTRITEIETDEKKQSAERLTLAAQTETLIKDIVTRRKDKNRKVNNKPTEKTVHEKVRLWIDDYDKAHKDFPGEDYNKITGGIDYSAESEQINALRISEKPTYEDNLAAEALATLERPYTKVDVPDSEVVSWLQSGLHIHESKDVCEFCGNNLDIGAITTRVNAFVNNEMHQATVRLEGYRKTLNELTEIAEDILNNKGVYVTLLGFDENDFADTEEAKTFLTSISGETIADKLKDMSTVGNIAGDLVAQMKVVDDVLAKLTDAKSRRSREITDKINRLEILVKGAIGFEIKNSTAISQNLEKLDEYGRKLTELDAEKQKLRGDNIKLASQKSDLADFAIYLNNVLSDLNLNFKLALSGKCYVLEHADGTTLKVSDISDGERNLLALVYFYYEMQGDSADALRDGVELIVIDDPISSLDDGNKFYITELVKSILAQDKAQVFLMTHSWDDFCNLTYGQSDKETVSRFEITKESGVSFINRIDSKRLVKPYKALYKEVFEFSQKSAGGVTNAEVLHMPNVMRRVIEEYIKFVVDVDFATAHKNGDISKALFGKELAELSNTKKQKLNQLLSVCNILSHKANQPKNGTEVHESAKFLINSMNDTSKYHHLKMVE
jgi:ABC-type cobalamin/Fe3+-siderophores transport system ATPase subunit